jgi:Na+/glutamate symporter
VIPQSTKKFLDSLIDYYISEAASYKQLAITCSDEAGDITSVTFGIIVGCIYSGFLQTFLNQKQKPSLEDTQEFTHLIKSRYSQIKRSILDSTESKNEDYKNGF